MFLVTWFMIISIRRHQKKKEPANHCGCRLPYPNQASLVAKTSLHQSELDAQIAFRDPQLSLRSNPETIDGKNTIQQVQILRLKLTFSRT
jgi:hypothetical protein